jgi:hypothetical protein
MSRKARFPNRFPSFPAAPGHAAGKPSKPPYASYFLKSRDPFVPPNPNEFERA